tara:strand:- start:3356 stop:3781 length:426 start_codon:yes stop_codon:yes gene_type:complete
MTDTTHTALIETINTHFKTLQEDLHTITVNTKQMSESLKTLHKTCRSAQKHSKNKNRVQSKNTLSDELEKFLSVEHGIHLTKAEVMKGISKYIKDKNLQLTENMRTFRADNKMQKVFGMDSQKPFTFVEIGGHISNHLTRV